MQGQWRMADICLMLTLFVAEKGDDQKQARHVRFCFRVSESYIALVTLNCDGPVEAHALPVLDMMLYLFSIQVVAMEGTVA